MARFLGFQFGSRFVSTKKYESFLNREKNDLERYTAFEKSELLARYNYLEGLVHSGEFKKKVHSLKNDKFKDTVQWRQLDQFNTIASAPDIKSYLKFVKSGNLERVKEVEASAELSEFLELDRFINSPAYHAARVKKDFKHSQEHAKESRHKQLLKDPGIKFYIATIKSQEYKNVLKLESSDRLKTYFELEAITGSSEFIEFKEFMEDKKRFKKSEEARLLAEHSSLVKNEEITWYIEKKRVDKFKEALRWELSFEDDFDSFKLNKERWTTGYYWGKALINDSYAVAGEKQIFKDSNIEIGDSLARIMTRQEEATGKVWEPVHGFTVQKFDYTSALLSTGQSFRQQYGKFVAKVRFSGSYPVVNAFWMVGEKMSPQVDIFKTSDSKGKSVECGLHVNAKNEQVEHRTKMVNGTKFPNKFFIYTLEWTKEAIVWKINGLEVHREVDKVPNEMMYLVFCTILPATPGKANMPSTLEIDWIRCYRLNND